MSFHLSDEAPKSLVKEIEDTAEIFGLTWKQYYGMGGDVSSLTGLAPSLVAGVISQSSNQSHLFSINEHPLSEFEHWSVVKIARAKLAETDCALACVAPIHVDYQDQTINNEMYDYIDIYVANFEKSSFLWATDLLDQYFPSHLDTLLQEIVAISLDNAAFLKETYAINGRTLFETINDAVFAEILANRSVNIDGTTGFNEARSLIANLRKLIPSLEVETFDRIWHSIYSIYVDLPQMPSDPDKAIEILAHKTRIHAEAANIIEHPSLVKNVLQKIQMRAIYLIFGHMVILDNKKS